MPKRLYILFFSSFIVMAGYGVLIPIQVLYSAEIGINATQYGLSLGIFAAAQLVTTPIFGKLGDTQGRAKFILISLVMYSIADFIMFFAQTYPEMLVGRALTGMSAGMLMPAISGYITDATNEKTRTKALM